MKHNYRVQIFPYLLMLYEITVFLSNDMYLPTMPAIAQELGLTQQQIQYTLTFWFLGASSLQFVLGPVSDRYGRKVVMIVGGLFFIAASAVCALADSLGLLLAARFVQGTGICSVMVAGYAAIHELFSTKEAIKIFALMGAITILAPAFGPLIGALIAHWSDWRYIFWILFGLGSIAISLLWLLMPESNINRHPLKISTIVKDYIKILTNKDFMLACCGYGFLVAIFFLWIFEAPFIMIEVYKVSPVYYGISQAFIWSSFFLSAWLTRLILTRWSLVLLLRVATIFSLVGTILFVLVARFLDNLALSVFCMMLISTGTSLLFGPINRIAIESSTQPMGRRTAVFSTIVSLFGVFCGWILTVVRCESLTDISVLIVICMAVASILLLFTRIPQIAKTLHD